MRYLVKTFNYKPSKTISFAIDLMCIHASKLWNTANYERIEYKNCGFEKEPDWFDQKKRLKENIHYKYLLAQSSQDLLKDLDCAWKSYHVLSSKNMMANVPNYKKYGQHTCVKYAHHSFKMMDDLSIRFSLPFFVKKAVKDKFNVQIDYFYVKLKQKLVGIKSITLKHIRPGVFSISVSYEINEPIYKKDNGRHIGIDLGVKNLFAVYDNNGSSFIINGSSFKNTIYYFSKKIAHYQRILKACSKDKASKQAYSSKRIRDLYKIKQGRINYLIHATTRKIANYCRDNDISVAVIGDMKGIKNSCSFGHVTKQQFYAVAFAKIVSVLRYKLDIIGVRLVTVDESYSSQCAPDSKMVAAAYGSKSRRKKRGLYKYQKKIYNADSLGAFNILRIYYQNNSESNHSLDYRCISNPKNECIPVTMDFFDYFPCLDMKKMVGVAGRNYPSGDDLILQIKQSFGLSAEA